MLIVVIQLSINEIKIVGLDEIRTHPVGQKNKMLRVYFELSRSPTKEWKDIFERQNKGTMTIDGRHVVVEAMSHEISKKMAEAKIAVTNANKKY
jgi:hypothetical protein